MTGSVDAPVLIFLLNRAERVRELIGVLRRVRLGRWGDGQPDYSSGTTREGLGTGNNPSAVPGESVELLEHQAAQFFSSANFDLPPRALREVVLATTANS